MAKRSQPLMPRWLIPGLLAALITTGIALLAFISLLWNAPLGHALYWLRDPYLWHVIGFSFTQAALSTLLSVLPAILVARALYRRRFPGRNLLLRLCAMTLVLPVLVAVFGLLSVYGHDGWLAQLAARAGIPFRFSLYGLPGILLAHIFFNLPLASRLLLQSLEQIPAEQRQLAAQLNMQGFYLFRWLEWPWLKRQLLPVAALIFMLCFSSFAIVLALGGGPRATTLELAIFQALSYDFDPAKAAILALLQLAFCLLLVALSLRLNTPLTGNSALLRHWRSVDNRWSARLTDSLIILLTLLLLVPPILAVVINGVNSHLLSSLQQTDLWLATRTSLSIALRAGLLSVILTMMLLWSSRELRLRQKILPAQLMESSGMLILAMPGIVLASGIFMFFNSTSGIPDSPENIVVLVNALIAMPYALKVLDTPMRDIASHYNQLCLSLDINGWQRLRLVEGPALKRPLAQALAFACVLSVGDFGVISLFGSDDFRTLPFYLYQQIGAYRGQQAAVSALLLLLVCFLLFTLIEKIAGHHADAE
ncbi:MULTISPECIES: thiamine/thiamine pyrophosphate ABC transporter permease ThiP [unclassified Tatumella]|uniref:thiamine/thiamine pyrophosphate ABC transporter permease ThiP n=1 Tax=unclassified Tatumella TaxID=2649542 RepID=UPI001BAE790A|nr:MULTISPECIES: thiamine/thiamine pyrophosphate ABC transporter permease ThiP [unclassified Tatumella]MBS0876865.1 thiamine/thiamine pyrophosphate ABC transporter permease ThiP [Tatumella sp. JGM82]MBS0889710.1 thiamine/thiamine pyrophosphate ABC transporter permease ThiP [Tatumella sp. JGM94]MBS0902832.1 thiamine/thiamine pyrophosphate ABC transporter permease ThiP [Tatumella sp. JGM100]